MAKLSEKRWEEIRNTIKSLLHASRDCLRNQGMDTTKISFSANDGYYGECFGMLRTLEILGHGKIGAVNIPEERTNLAWWFHQLQDEVLKEENFRGSNECDHCLRKWGKDAAGRNKSDLELTS